MRRVWIGFLLLFVKQLRQALAAAAAAHPFVYFTS